MKNKIGWCDMTWNPCWGCRNKCPYCYARAFAKRFGAVRFMEEWKYRTEHNMDAVRFKLQNSLDLIDFKPTFLYSQIGKRLPKKPQRIFVGSMSEIYYWEQEWIEKVIEKVKQYPQHTFQFLTKHPKVYLNYDFPKNCWLGITVTTNLALYETDFITNKANEKRIKFICFEPMRNDIEPSYIPKNIDWVIVGAETGNRSLDLMVLPKIRWVLNIIKYCKANNLPIYIKDNLSIYYKMCQGYKQFPKEAGL